MDNFTNLGGVFYMATQRFELVLCSQEVTLGREGRRNEQLQIFSK